MRKFTDTYKTIKKISLDEFDESVKTKLKEIDGMIVSEYCCDICQKCQCPDTSTDQPIGQLPITFFNENDVISALKSNAKVQTLFSITNQFNCDRFRSTEARTFLNSEPLYFLETQGLYSPQHIFDDSMFNRFVKGLMKKHGLECPVILTDVSGQTTVFALKHAGTNGKECSIKNSLMDIYNLLEALDSHEEVSKSSCADISIDNLDDVYTFLVTIYVDNVYLAQLQQRHDTI